MGKDSQTPPPPVPHAQSIEAAEEKLSHPKYRPDIDGLRAVAVLSVVVFHAFPSLIRGGFIGVDIFFVISGFLISTIIFENLENNTFSFTGFYARRIRRIFPALLLVLMFSYAFGWIALFADEYKQLGKHIAAGAGFVSNLVLWGESGYFDNSSDTKPLLHLWSLGIEEQFYIVWPFVLWLAWKKRGNLLVLSILVWFLSLYLNIRGVRKDAVATFYSPQTRFWELFSGSILAWLVLHNKNTLLDYRVKVDRFLSRIFSRGHVEADGRTLSNVISFAGCLLLVYGFWRIKNTLSFPGAWAMVPVLGAALIILAGPNAWFNRTVLSNKIAVWFGLISFPLYLWHWPLLTFTRIVGSGTPDGSMRMAAVVLSVVLAWLTYRFIERPIRFGKSGKAKVFVLAFLMLVTGGIGYNAYERNGLAFREVVSLNQDVMPPDDDGKYLDTEMIEGCGIAAESRNLFQICAQDKRGNVRFALMGDSKAFSLHTGLVRTSDETGRWLFIGGATEAVINGQKRGVSPWPILDSYPDPERPSTTRAVEAITNNQDIEVVALAAAIRSIVPGYPVFRNGKFNTAYLSMFTPDQDTLNMVFDRVNRVVEIFVSAGKKVVLVVDHPALADTKDCIKRSTSSALINRLFDGHDNDCAVSLDEFNAQTRGYREMLSKVESRHPGLAYVFDPTDVYCDTADNMCKAFRYGRPLYGYGAADHISDFAAGIVGKKLNDFIKNIESQEASVHSSHANFLP